MVGLLLDTKCISSLANVGFLFCFVMFWGFFVCLFVLAFGTFK